MLRYDTDLGSVIITDSVICSIIANIANHCFGVAGMAARTVTEELWDLFRKDKLDKGIHVKTENNLIYIDIHIMVVYGINIPAITESIIHKVVYTVEQATGFTVGDINVYVDGIITK